MVRGLGSKVPTFYKTYNEFQKWGNPYVPKNAIVHVQGPPVQDSIVSKPPCRDLSKPGALRTP